MFLYPVASIFLPSRVKLTLAEANLQGLPPRLHILPHLLHSLSATHLDRQQPILSVRTLCAEIHPTDPHPALHEGLGLRGGESLLNL